MRGREGGRVRSKESGRKEFVTNEESKMKRKREEQQGTL